MFAKSDRNKLDLQKNTNFQQIAFHIGKYTSFWLLQFLSDFVLPEAALRAATKDIERDTRVDSFSTEQMGLKVTRKISSFSFSLIRQQTRKVTSDQAVFFLRELGCKYGTVLFGVSERFV